jgi:hypothetical protein
MRVSGATFNYPNGNLLMKVDNIEGEINEVIQFMNAGLQQSGDIVRIGTQMLDLYIRARHEGIEFSKLWDQVGAGMKTPSKQ